MNDTLKSIGSVAVGLLIVVAALVILGLLLGGAAWVSDELFPWFSKASVVAFCALIFVLLPLSAIRSTRSFAVAAILCVSYIFGATVWMEGFLITLAVWGTLGVVIGLFFLGVGVVPIAMLGTLFHGQWAQLGELVVLAILTFGSRFFALWLDEKSHTTTFLNE